MSSGIARTEACAHPQEVIAILDFASDNMVGGRSGACDV